MQTRGEQFAKEQDDIDRRLGVVTQSSTSEDAVTQFEASMDKLRRLDIAAGYVEMLKEVDQLRSTNMLLPEKAWTDKTAERNAPRPSEVTTPKHSTHTDGFETFTPRW